MAFFFHNSVLGRIVAQYPSPAGATESLLDLAAWDAIAAANPLAPRAGARRRGADRAPDPARATRATSSRSTPATSWSGGSGCTGRASTAERRRGKTSRSSSRGCGARVVRSARRWGRPMPELVFDCIDVRADPYAAGPTLVFSCASRRRPESASTRSRCAASCGSSRRSAGTPPLRRGSSTTCSATPRAGRTRSSRCSSPTCGDGAELHRRRRGRPSGARAPTTSRSPRPATSTRCRQGDIPFLLLFSGTVFTRGETGFSVAQVPWHKEATYRLPVTEWRAMMDAFLPEQRLAAAAPRHAGGAGCVQERPRPADLGAGRDDSARRSGRLSAGGP